MKTCISGVTNLAETNKNFTKCWLINDIKKTTWDVVTLTSGFGRSPLPAALTFDRSTANVTLVAFIVHHRINQVEGAQFHCILHLGQGWGKKLQLIWQVNIVVKFVFRVYVFLLFHATICYFLRLQIPLSSPTLVSITSCATLNCTYLWHREAWRRSRFRHPHM